MPGIRGAHALRLGPALPSLQPGARQMDRWLGILIWTVKEVQGGGEPGWRYLPTPMPPLPAPTLPMLSKEGSGTMLGRGWGQEESLWPGQAQSHMGVGLSPGVPLPHWTAYSLDRAPARGPNT